jgi:hypothetical protein
MLFHKLIIPTLLLTVLSSHAAEIRPSMTVSASLEASCKIVVEDLPFGELKFSSNSGIYRVNGSRFAYATSLYSVHCTNLTPYSLDVSSLHPKSNDVFGLANLDLSTSDQISYKAFLTIDGTDHSLDSIAPLQFISNGIKVIGSANAVVDSNDNQYSVKAGDYIDTLTINMSY